MGLSIGGRKDNMCKSREERALVALAIATAIENVIM
jgi:hypothetical protein